MCEAPELALSFAVHSSRSDSGRLGLHRRTKYRRGVVYIGVVWLYALKAVAVQSIKLPAVVRLYVNHGS